MGLMLAFEYDAKSPGMWQVATQHFDMDIGWVHESQPPGIASLRQVKVVAGVLDAMHASLEKGQLSLEGPERRLASTAPRPRSPTSRPASGSSRSPGGWSR